MKALESVNPELNHSVDNILNTFGGADGGVKFARFCSMLVEVDKQAKAGNESAKRLLSIVNQFSRLVDAA